jgi:5'-3' exonuclease
MGIPSYFGHLLRNHPHLIRKLQTTIDNLYMDANSILYDTYHENSGMTDDEHYLSVCRRIVEIISEVSPKKCVYIAFDGVAPIAKLKQQRDRRIKSEYLRILKSMLDGETHKTDTIKLTSGTPFMNHLGTYMNDYFKSFQESQPDIKIFISPPTEIGEGEHKLFHHIRANQAYHVTTNTAIYGLDADLIMLCLAHSNVPLWIVRERPHFEKTTEKDLFEFPIQIFVDILKTELKSENAIDNYVFLCFLLGNDFLPHFPTINIRTNGIRILMERMKEYNTSLINEHRELDISKFIEFIHPFSKKEHYMLQNEIEIRERMSRKHTTDEPYKKIEMTPLFERETEYWIDPKKEYWQERYYEALFPPDVKINHAVHQYIKGLVWCWKYYTSGMKGISPIKNWYYPYDYPPLIQDIIRYSPKFHIVPDKVPIPLSHSLQLCYVIPPNYRRKYIPVDLYKKIFGDLDDTFDIMNIEFETAFCKFLWESHPKLIGAHYFPSVNDIYKKM